MPTSYRPSGHNLVTATRKTAGAPCRAKLTKRAVEALKAPRAETGAIVWDSELRGFGVRVFPSGLKRFLIRYRNSAGRKRYVTVGTFGTLTIEQARDHARQLLAASERGEDPAAESEAKRVSISFSELSERYLAEHADTKKKASSARMDRWYLARFALPAFGAKKLSEIEPRDVGSLLHKLRKIPTTSNRVRALLGKMFSLAETWRLRPQGSNPVRGTEPFREKHRERFLSQQEIARLGSVLREAEGKESPQALAALRLLLLTGCRKGEILSLKWSEVDFERHSLRLEDSKSGAKTVPLSSAARALLASLPRLEGNPYVLPGKKSGAHFVNVKDPWRRIRANAGIPDVHIHDLRHTFAAQGASFGAGLPILGKILGHRSPTTTNRYAQLAPDPVHQVAERISSELDALLRGSPEAPIAAFKPKNSLRAVVTK